MTDLERKIKRLKGLKQYKDKSEEELELIAKEKLEQEEILHNLAFCIDVKEKKLASNLLEKYLSESSIESNADKDTLKQLIDMEILIERIKQFLKKEYEKNNSAIPTQMMEELRKNNELILTLKEKLGLTNKDKESSTWLETYDLLKKKALKYYEEHKGCNVVKCPHCQNFFMLLMRTEHLEPKKATMFRGTILYNKKLFELYDQKRLNEKEFAEILGVSPYYIEFMYNNIYLKEKNNAT